MIFKLIIVFISWALSLAIISDINKLLNSEVSNYIFGILHLIKKGITKVILLLTEDVILNIIYFCLYLKYLNFIVKHIHIHIKLLILLLNLEIIMIIFKEK